MKVLVTGASGFLGSWLVEKLLAEGLEVRILHRSGSDLSLLPGENIEKFLGDVCDPPSINEACKGVDSVFHLAGVVAYSKRQFSLMQKVNVGGTKNVVKACEQTGIRRLIHLSSVVAVGAGFKKNQVLNESSKFNLDHLQLGYFDTKRQGEKIVKEACYSKKVEAVILNPSTIYGPGDARKGSRRVQLKVARGQFRFYTSGGVNVVSVEDVVDGIYQAWQRGRVGERYILGGENITIKKLFETIASEAGVKPPSIYLPNPVVHAVGRLGDLLEKVEKKGLLNSENAWTSVLFHWFDSQKAREELDFNPRPAVYAIGQSVDWIRQQGWI